MLDITETTQQQIEQAQSLIDDNTLDDVQGTSAIGIMVPIVATIIAAVFIGVLVLIFSSKARGKMMSKQIKATKYAIDHNEDAIRDISTKTANATKEGIETTVRAIKKGIKED